jgi:type IV pilus assembly protein PilM
MDKIINSIRNMFLHFKKNIDSVLIVDLSSNLKLFNIEIIPELKVTAFKAIELPKDKPEEFIIDSIWGFISENNIKHKNAILCPFLSSILIKRLQLPVVPDEEMPEVIGWQIKDEIKFDLSKVVLDYKVIKKTQKEDGSAAVDVICVAANEEDLIWQVKILRHLEFACLSVNIVQFGYAAIIEKYLKGESFGFMHFEENHSSFSVYKYGTLSFDREIPLSISKLRESLSSTLVSDKGTVKLSPEEVDEVLFQIGVPLNDSTAHAKAGSAQILSLIRPGLERLAMEIKRSIAYYDSQFQEGGVNELMFAGLGINVPTIDKFLSKELFLNITKLSLLDKIKFSSDINPFFITRNYGSIGLAINFSKNINLLPYEFKVEKAEKTQKFVIRWTTFIAVSVLLIAFGFLKSVTGMYQKRFDNVKGHLTILAQVKETKEKIDELNNFFIVERQSEPPTDVILKKLSLITPAEIFIENYTMNYEAKNGVMTGVVKGVFGDEHEVILAKFINDMAGSGYFKDISIVSVDRNIQEGKNVAMFKIVFKVV